MPKTYPIPAELMVKLSRYLQARPWGEVNEFMFEIANVCRPIDEAEARQQQMMSGAAVPPGAGAGDAPPKLPPAPPQDAAPGPNGGHSVATPLRRRGKQPHLRDVSDPPPKEPA